MATHYTCALRILFLFFARFRLLCFLCRSSRFRCSGRCRLFRSFFLLRRKLDSHTLTFQYRHLIHFCIVFQIIRKTKQQYFALFLKKDRTTFKEYISLHLITVFQESFSMFQLKVVIMVICLGTKTNLLHINLHLLRFLFLLTFL